MIKPESNAPASMKPWVRTTDKQIEELETAVSKITNAINAGNGSIDHEQNQSLSNTFSFTPLDDGSTVTNSQAMNFTGAITSESDVSIAGSLVVGDPSRQEYDPLSGEAVGSIPNLEVISGQLEINPITELEYYTTGEFNVTDTSFNVDGYGLIHGDGLQITLANDGQAERQNIEILGATGTGTAETFQIANNASNVAIYTAGRYVNITGVDPAGYNGNNLLVTSVNTGISPMTFTVAGTETATWVAGGYVTINDANSIYEGKLTVQGPAPDYTGVTISQDGVFVGSNGGDSALSDVVLDSNGLTAPSAFIDQAVINGTRLFISDTAPTAVNDGDIWIDKTGIFTQGSSYVLPKATASALGGVELFSDTVQTTAANAVTTTAGRTYGVQMNSTDQLVVNVPWENPFTSQAKQLFLASPTSASGVPTFRYISTSDFTQFSSPAIGQALIAAPVTGGWSWGSFLPTYGGTLTGNLILAAGGTSVTPLRFTANTSAQQLQTGVMDYDGNAFFGTPKVNNSTAGRGLIPTQQIFIPNANTTIVTTSGSTGTFSGDVMGGKAIYLAASTTYEVDAVLYVQHTWTGTQTNNFTINLLYPSGSTALINGVASFGTSTTVSGTASQIGLNSTTAVVIASSPTSGNWYRVRLHGIIKTSTTAGDFSPTFGYTSISGATTATNTVGANSFIKVNPIAGVGADINIGGWA